MNRLKRMAHLLILKADLVLKVVPKRAHRIVQSHVSNGVRNAVAWDIGVHLLNVKQPLKNTMAMVVVLKGSRNGGHPHVNFATEAIPSDVRLELVVEAFIAWVNIRKLLASLVRTLMSPVMVSIRSTLFWGMDRTESWSTSSVWLRL